MTGRDDLRAYTGSLAFRMPKDRERLVFQNLAIDLFANPELAPVMAKQVRGRHILIGGDLPDVDRFETPETRLADEKSDDGKDYRATTAGLEIHATMLAQVLDGRLPGRIGSTALWALAILVVLSGAFTAMLDVRPWVLGLAVLGQFAFYGVAPFWFETSNIDTQGLPAFGWLAGWMLAFATTGAAVRAIGSDQRRFAQSALGQISAPRRRRADPARSRQIVADRRAPRHLLPVHRHRGVHQAEPRDSGRKDRVDPQCLSRRDE